MFNISRFIIIFFLLLTSTLLTLLLSFGLPTKKNFKKEKISSHQIKKN